MRPIALLAVLLISLALPGAVHAASPFGGYWRGTWSDAGSGQGGTAELGVDAEGGVDGRVSNSSSRATGPIWGSVADGGQLNLTYSYDGGRTMFSAQGPLRRSGDTLAGTVTFRTLGGQVIGQGLFRLQLSDAPASRKPDPSGAATTAPSQPDTKPEPAPVTRPTPPVPRPTPSPPRPQPNTPVPPQPTPPQPVPEKPATIFGVPVAPVRPVVPPR